MTQERRFDPKEIASFIKIPQPFTTMPKLEEFLEYWIKEVVYPNKTKNTFTTYYSAIRAHVVPMMGDYRIDEIDKNILSYYIEKKHTSEQQPLSAKTIQCHINMIKQAMKYALELHLINSNPCNDVVLPKVIKKEIEVFTAQQQMLMNASVDATWKPNSMVSAYLGNMLGLRIGETAALRLDDLDFEKRCIRIDETYGRVAYIEDDKVVYRLQFGETKSKKVRILPMSDEVYQVLKQYVESMPQDFTQQSDTLLFTNSKGNPIEPRLLRYHYKQFLKKLEIPHCKFHTLRHTFATRGIEMRMEVNTLSKALGHASVNITESCYVHISDVQLKREMSQYTSSNIKKLI